MARYHVRQLALDGNDLDALVDFWLAALGYELDHRDEGYAVLRDPDGAEPRVFLQQAKQGKNRAHFDIAVPDEAEAVERLVGQGCPGALARGFPDPPLDGPGRPAGQRVLRRRLRLARQRTPQKTRRHQRRVLSTRRRMLQGMLGPPPWMQRPTSSTTQVPAQSPP